jgi:aspartate/methionine/tyrosine aminotransferase
MVYSQRSRRIEPFRVMQLMGRAKALERAGRAIVHFEVGEPDFATAAPIVAAGRNALAAGRTKYTEATGIPELKQAIAAFYRHRAGIELDPRRVIITSGASGALNLLSALLVDPEDEWLMADPGYPCNRHFWMLAGAVTRLVPVGPESGFQLTAALADSHWDGRCRGLLTASPANPTGAVLTRAEAAGLVQFARKHDAYLIMDEIYQGLTYESAAPREDTGFNTVLELAPEAFVVNSFSKYFGMTGWRLGWIVAPEPALAPLERLAQNLYISPSSVAQYAALAAFDGAAMTEHERRRQAFMRRRDVLRAGLTHMGLPPAVEAAGAFYLYVDVSHTGLAAEEFCDRMLEEAGVAITPGTDFGRYRADAFVRFAYTTDEASIGEGLTRMAPLLSRWAG